MVGAKVASAGAEEGEVVVAEHTAVTVVSLFCGPEDIDVERHSFRKDQLTLSFLDAANEGRPIIALHAHWMEGATFRRFAADLAPDWRVIAPDQRGDGYSDHASTYRRGDYLSDLLALLDHLAVERAVLLGNSLGGVNAFQFAARHSDRVQALVIEDIGAVIGDDTSFALAWSGLFPTRKALEAAVGDRLMPALEPAIRETAEGWRLAFEPRDTIVSQQELNGDHWIDWLASRCPALIIRGRDSRVSNPALFNEMARRRQNVQFVELAGGHVVHFDNPDGFATAVREFLARAVA